MERAKEQQLSELMKEKSVELVRILNMGKLDLTERTRITGELDGYRMALEERNRPPRPTQLRDTVSVSSGVTAPFVSPIRVGGEKSV